MSQTARSSGRIAAIDAARGAAIAGMFVYHFIWDLGFFRVVAPEFPASPGFKFFGHIIAATFLALVGISHALATRNGIKWQPWLLRLLMVVEAAALVSLATYYLFPDSAIFFGILHCIVVASLIVLLFTRVPWPITALVAFAMIVSPWFAHPMFDGSNWWLGFGIAEPRSNDWRPVLPWSGFALAGLALAQAVPFVRWPARWLAWQPTNRPGHLLVQGGRHSLLIYLLHQPVLLAIAFLISLLVVPRQPPDPTTTLFQRACETRCMDVRPDQAYCSRTCSCVVTEARASGLWGKVVQNNLDPGERVKYDALTQQCVRSANP